MVAIHRCNNRNERPHGFQVAALERGVRDAQRLGEPRDLQVDIALRRVELARTTTASISRRIVRTLNLAGLRRSLGTEAGREEVERTLAQASLAFLRAFAAARSRARPDCGS